MELSTCIECGRSFGSKNGEKLCKRCSEKKVDDDFKKVRADIKVVSEETGVEEAIILKLLRQDRLEVVDEATSIIKCRSCGKPIKSGKLCENCKKVELAKSLQSMGEDIQKSIQESQNKKVAYFRDK